MKYLIDTNILSEARKKNPNRGVKNFFKDVADCNIFISVITIGEISYGIKKLENGIKKYDLSAWLENAVIHCNIIDINIDIILEWSSLRSKHKKTLPIIDSLIAATAIVHNMTVVTRNIKDFENIEGLSVLNPFNE